MAALTIVCALGFIGDVSALLAGAIAPIRALTTLCAGRRTSKRRLLVVSSNRLLVIPYPTAVQREQLIAAKPPLTHDRAQTRATQFEKSDWFEGEKLRVADVPFEYAAFQSPAVGAGHR